MSDQLLEWMESVNEEAFAALNFHKVLVAVADKASTSYGCAHVLKLRPMHLEPHERTDVFDRIGQLTVLVQKGEELPFLGIRNLEDALLRAEIPGTHLEAGQLLDVAALIVGAKRLKQHITARQSMLSSLQEFAEEIEELPELERRIHRVIDINAVEVVDDATPDLSQLRKKIRSLTAKSRRRLEDLVRTYSDAGLLLDSGYSVRDGRFVLAVKSSFKGRVKGIVHDVSASGGTFYIEPDDLVSMGNEMREVVEKEAEEVRRVLTELTDLVREQIEPLRDYEEIVASLDSMQARARFADRVGAMRPVIAEGNLRLVQARHPLLVLRKGIEKTVPLDLHLNDDGRVLVITGPNAGGKTVALKTVGLITSLIHANIWPPCGDGTIVPPIDVWHVVIGDDQSLEGDLSSFTGHLEKLKAITDEADLRKLVLIDEIASGTDPTEGGALAMSFMEDAISWGWWTLVSTHMGSLKAFAHRDSSVRNGSMQFDKEALTPTYHFQPDLPGSSYALEIAERVGLPIGMVRRARRHLGEERLKLEDLIEELSSRLHNVQQRERELSLKQTETSGLERIFRERIDRFDAKKGERLEKAAMEADRILRDANRTIERTVKQLREEQASREAIKQAKERVQQQLEAVAAVEKEARQKKAKRPEKKKPELKPMKPTFAKEEPELQVDPSAPVEVGDTVRLPNGMEGEVLALQKEKAQVAAGAVKLWFSVALLQKTIGSKPGGRKSGFSVHLVDQEDDRPVGMELKLLGMRYEDAETELEGYLEKLALAGLKVARIVHGKGTGTLRAMVQERVKRHPLVRKYRYGEPGEGGDGVTIIELRD